MCRFAMEESSLCLEVTLCCPSCAVDTNQVRSTAKVKLKFDCECESSSRLNLHMD